MTEAALDTLITYNPWTLVPHTPLAEAARLLDEMALSHWPVLDEQGESLGTLSVCQLAAGLAADPAATIQRWIDRNASAIQLGSCSLEVLEQMLANDRRMVPVIEGGRVIGTLSTCDFLRDLSLVGGRYARESIVDYVERSAEPIDSDATLAEAEALLASNTHLVVVQGDFPLGVVTPTSLAIARVQQFARQQRGAANAVRTVGQLLQACPTVQPGRTLAEASSLMVDHSLDALAVANQGAKLLGVITERAILRGMLE